MDPTVQAQVAHYLSHVTRLIRRGRELHESLARQAGSAAIPAETRIWQQDCAELINQLSGGSKAHWLSRAFSDAFLVRSTGDRVIEQVDPADIVGRLLRVLERAAESLSQADNAPAPDAPRRFEFVHNAELRPILERAYADSRAALDRGDFGEALITSCSVLEAIITDALVMHERQARGGAAGDDSAIAGWSFEQRIAAAEQAALIRRGCARLPPIARTYRECADATGAPRPDVAIAERDARVSSQVLHVVMRDLDPGR